VRPPVQAVAQAHATLATHVANLDDDQVAAPSALPGWSRGHVLAHLTDNARMFARLAEHALRGELIATYDGGQAERDTIIEATAGRTADEHRAALAEQTARLEAVWARVADEDWTRPVTFRNADIAATVHARWREAWIHLVDLDLGVGPDDWPADLAAHAVDFLLTRLPPGARLHAEDLNRDWTAGHPSTGGQDPSGGDGSARVITDRVNNLAAWLAGRTPTVPLTSATGLPELGPWPPHPPPAG
jgi:maleylpyruvate isomerase